MNDIQAGRFRGMTMHEALTFLMREHDWTDDDNMDGLASEVIALFNQQDAEQSEAGETPWDAAVERVREAYPRWLLDALPRLSSGLLEDIDQRARQILQDRFESGAVE